jgi:hypothetical protein
VSHVVSLIDSCAMTTNSVDRHSSIRSLTTRVFSPPREDRKPPAA